MNSSLQIIPAYIENKVHYYIIKVHYILVHYIKKGIILCVFVCDKRTSRKELHLNIKKLAIVVYISEKLYNYVSQNMMLFHV